MRVGLHGSDELGVVALFFVATVHFGGLADGLKSLSDEIRWFGGYKTLLELLELYGEIVLAIALFWLCWTLLLSWRHSVVAPKRTAPVTDQQLAVVFKVDLAGLREARTANKLTVHFDEHAGITAIRHD